MPIRFLIIVFFGIVLTGCGHKTEKPRKVSSSGPAGEIKVTKVFISPDEYLTVMDIPDNYIGKRCWVYVNDKIKTSHMKCDDDFAKLE